MQYTTNFLINNLKLKPSKHNNLQGKCPYCGDSPKENHFGILLSEPIVFNCFRCNTSGTIHKLARDFNLDLYNLLYTLNYLYKDSIPVNISIDLNKFIKNNYIKIENYLDNTKYLEYLSKRKINNNYKLDNLYINPTKKDYIFFYLSNKFIGRNIYNNNPRYLIYNITHNNPFAILYKMFYRDKSIYFRNISYDKDIDSPPLAIYNKSYDKINTNYFRNKIYDKDISDKDNIYKAYDRNISIYNRDKSYDNIDIYITEGIFDLYSIVEYYPDKNLIVYATLSNIISKDLCDDILYHTKIYKNIKNIYISLDKDINIYNKSKIVKNILYLKSNLPDYINIYNIVYPQKEKDINELLINNKKLEYESINYSKLLKEYYRVF